jgi:hypothetical protein
MEENIISWNVANWITVILMAMVGFFIFGLIQKSIQKASPAPPAPAQSNNNPNQGASS